VTQLRAGHAVVIARWQLVRSTQENSVDASAIPISSATSRAGRS
jgi:hypothetical protein